MAQRRQAATGSADGVAITAQPKPAPSPYYILPKAAHLDERVLVLKHDDTFAVFDRFGDIQPGGMGEQGIYHEGTRFLSKSILHLGGKRPQLLSSTVRTDNVLVGVDLSNPDVYSKGQMLLPRGTLHLFRAKFLWNGVCYERLRVTNFGLTRVESSVSLRIDNDFFDVFEVRGQRRPARGEMLEPLVEPDAIELGYKGLDGVIRRVRMEATPAPARTTASEMLFRVRLEAQEQTDLYFVTSCHIGNHNPDLEPFDEALRKASRALHLPSPQECSIYTSNEQFNDWLNRSVADLRMMITSMSTGPYPYAGVPWFSTPFGRDAIITALEYLWLDPELAKGVLSYLAATQSAEINPESDAEPGKIMHEARSGEMAALKEVPFGRYYGSVDSTPLFLILAAAYFRRTGDVAFIEAIWPNIEAALAWID